MPPHFAWGCRARLHQRSSHRDLWLLSHLSLFLYRHYIPQWLALIDILVELAFVEVLIDLVEVRFGRYTVPNTDVKGIDAPLGLDVLHYVHDKCENLLYHLLLAEVSVAVVYDNFLSYLHTYITFLHLRIHSTTSSTAIPSSTYPPPIRARCQTDSSRSTSMTSIWLV